MTRFGLFSRSFCYALGLGVYSWADGRRYVGNYTNDLKEGFGTFQWPDGRSYQGQWLGGSQHLKVLPADLNRWKPH